MLPSYGLPYPAAMANDQTFGELYMAKAILDADLEAVKEAFVAGPALTAFLLGEGYTTNVHATVSASTIALTMMAKTDIKSGSKRAAVRTAILLLMPAEA